MYDSREDLVLDKPWDNIQMGFFIKEETMHDDEETDIHFTIKCKNTDYQIIFTKNGPSV